MVPRSSIAFKLTPNPNRTEGNGALAALTPPNAPNRPNCSRLENSSASSQHRSARWNHFVSVRAGSSRTTLLPSAWAKMDFLYPLAGGRAIRRIAVHVRATPGRQDAVLDLRNEPLRSGRVVGLRSVI